MGNTESATKSQFGGFEEENRTHFRLMELKKLHEEFATRMNADGKLSRDQLSEALGLQGQLDMDFLQRLYVAFDTDNCGKVNFREFVSALSVLSRGEIAEKAAFAFDLFDSDHDGAISQEELRACLKAMNTALGGLEQGAAQTEEDLEVMIKETFEADNNHDGVLSLEEFIHAVQQHPRLLDFEKILGRPKAEEFSKLHYLVCLDSSDYADRAFEHTINTVSPTARITLLYVHAPADDSHRPPLMPVKNYQGQHDRFGKMMESFLTRYKARAEGKVPTQVRWEKGEPAKTISDISKALSVDVVVVGAHGRFHSGGADHGIKPGKVARQLVNICPATVMIVK